MYRAIYKKQAISSKLIHERSRATIGVVMHALYKNFLHYLLILGSFTTAGSLYSAKILVFTYAFPETVQEFILNQITGLIDHGHEVSILATESANYIKSHRSVVATTQELHPDVIKYNLLEKTYVKKLPADKREFDIILCQFGTLAPLLFKYHKEQNIQGKIVTFFRGYDISSALRKNPGLYKQLFKEGALFLAVCKYFKRRLVAAGCPIEKIRVAHSAIDCSRFPFRERAPANDGTIRIVSTSRLIEKKGIDYAIKAVAELLKKYPNIEYIVIGGGPLEAKLHKLAKDLGVQDKVRFVGWQSNENVIKILDTAHIFILPSITDKDGDQEGIPNALKEAMAMGLPVVSTYHSGIPELVENGKSGFLVSEHNREQLVEKLANKLEYLITHPEEWPLLGHAGRTMILNKFNKQKENSKLHRLFTELIS